LVPPGQIPTLPASSVSTSQFTRSRPESAVAATDNSLGFYDLIDIVNPLQHIPVVNSIYQNITGDSIKPIISVAGGMLFGGPIGAVVALITNIVKAGFKDQPDEAVSNLVNQSEPDVQSIKLADDTGGKQDWNAYQQALASLGLQSDRIDNLRPRNINAANVQQTYSALNDKKDAHAKSGKMATDALTADDEKRLFAARIRDSV